MSTHATPPHDELPLGQIFAILWRSRWIIALSTLAALGVGWYRAELEGTVWRARSRLYVERRGPKILGANDLLAADGWNYTKTQAEVLRSTALLREVAAQPGLTDTPILAGVHNPVAWLKRNLAVDANDDILTISLTSTERTAAVEVVNSVVSAYSDFHARRRQNTSAQVLEHLTEQKANLSAEYLAEMKKLTEFRKENQLLDSTGRSVVTDKWRALTQALAQAEEETREAEQAWRTADALKATDPALLREILPSLQGQAGPGTANSDGPAVAAEVQRLELRRAELLRHYTPELPEVAAVERALAKRREDLEARDKEFAEAYVAALQQRYASAAAKRDQLRKEAQSNEERVVALNARDADYRLLEAKADQAKRMHDLIDMRIREIDINDLDDDSSVNVLDFAAVDETEEVSNRPRKLALAAALGLLIGMAIAWLRGLLDQRMRDADEVATSLQLPLLGVLPRSAEGRRAGPQTAPGRWDEDRRFAEAARSLRTAVYFGAGGHGKVIHVTSPESGDGKTTIAANLGIAMAKAGQRTLIIDADLRRPRQATLFDLPAAPGLAAVLAGEAETEREIVATDVPLLDLLPSGDIPAAPAELLNSDRVARLLADVAERYDRIIVDSPPVLPVADARIIAGRCEGSLLVVRVDRSTRRRAVAALESLKGVGANVLGVVVNGMPSGRGYGRYGDRYGYGYGEGEEGRDDAATNPTSPGPRRPRRKRGGRSAAS
ncbi:MAG: polysaccharide biosynthesis tyrosine autokinase [Planctomycetota bacterium]